MQPAEADAVTDGGSSISDGDARSELERVLSDPVFHCSERNKKFLRYISEEYLSGRQERLKGYTIATDVFGRPDNFNPSSDGIVRIEATRLRAALIRYYETKGYPEGIEIRLPKGHYVPEFVRIPQRRRTDGLAPIAAQTWASLNERVRHILDAWALPRKAVLSGGVTVAALALVGTLLTFEHRGVRITDRPTVAVELTLSGGAEDQRAVLVRDKLMIALSDFNSLRLSADSYTASIGPRVSPDEGTRSRYHILLKYRAEARNRSIWWQVTDRDGGETLRVGEESAPLDDLSPNEADDRLVSRLAVRLASMRGVINSAEAARDLDTPSLGNGCVLRAGLALSTRNVDLLADARSCLERTLKLRPHDADAHAMLSVVLLASDPDRISTELANLASNHAEEAVALAPESDRSYMAQMMAAFRVGQLETARQAGNRAIALNPYNPAIAAKFSSILFKMGDWEHAALLARKALVIDDIPQPDAERTLAFDAYRRGAYDEAIVRLRGMSNDRCLVTQFLLTASLAKAGDDTEAATVLASIAGDRPHFEQTFRPDMERRQLAPVLIEALQAGLGLAGPKAN